MICRLDLESMSTETSIMNRRIESAFNTELDGILYQEGDQGITVIPATPKPQGSELEDRSLWGPSYEHARSDLALIDRLARDSGNKVIPSLDEVEEFRQASPWQHVYRVQAGIPEPVNATCSTPCGRAFGRNYGGRRLFTTKKGYLGLGPYSAEVGDRVCILPGSDMPFVLRKSNGTQSEPESPVPSIDHESAHRLQIRLGKRPRQILARLVSLPALMQATLTSQPQHLLASSLMRLTIAKLYHRS